MKLQQLYLIKFFFFVKVDWMSDPDLVIVASCYPVTIVDLIDFWNQSQKFD